MEMKVEELKRELADDWCREHGEAIEMERESFLSDLNTLIEKVIEERMPTEEEIIKESHYGERYRFSEFKRACDWFRSRMKGGEK